MGFKLVRLLLPVVASLGLVVSQDNPIPIMEVLSKCGSLLVGTSVGLNADCRTFAVCPSRFNLRQQIQYCPPGTLFDSDTNTCNFARDVTCAASDPCAGRSDGYHPDDMRSKPSQASVLECESGRTVGGVKCNECQQFSPNSESVCFDIPDCVRTEIIFDCNLESDPQNNNMYFALGPGTRTPMDCANGTVFSQEICGCVSAS